MRFLPSAEDSFLIIDGFTFEGMFSNVVDNRVYFDEGSFLLSFGSSSFSDEQLALTGFRAVPEPTSVWILLLLFLFKCQLRTRR
jgi:hypothetical protein